MECNQCSGIAVCPNALHNGFTSSLVRRSRLRGRQDPAHSSNQLFGHLEVKKKVKESLEQIQLKFNIIDQLTAYMPSLQIVALVAQVYSLFNRFVAKAIKHYTRNRLSE